MRYVPTLLILSCFLAGGEALRPAPRPLLDLTGAHGVTARALRLGGGAAQEVARPPQALLSRALGYVITAGSCILYLPIIAGILSARSAGGLSLVTWWLFLVSSLGSIVYPLRMGLPLNSFSEFAALVVQAAVVLGLILAFEGAGALAPAVVSSVALAAAGAAWVATSGPLWAAGVVQTAATGFWAVSLLPQVASNFRTRTSGGWSAVSALLATGGNAIRVWTTATVTADPLLLASKLLGTGLNALLLAQCLAFPAPAR